MTKVYPRFSETFILNEVLAHQAAGADLEIFSLRPPTEGRFHAAVADVGYPVTYLPESASRTATVWEALRRAAAELELRPVVEELFEAEPRDVLQAIALATAVRQRGISHLHAHFASLPATVTRLAAALASVTWSFTAHAKDIFHASVDDRDLRRKLSDAAFTVTVSDYNAEHLRTRFGAAAAKVTRVYNGLDLASFPFTAPAVRPAVVVGVGRLVAKKGFTHLIDAFASLDRDDVRCEIIGDGVLADALRAQITAQGVGDRVTLVGPLPQHELRVRVRTAAALVAPCVVSVDGDRDGLPTVLLEAMAVGTPCVSTPVTGIPEAIVDGDTGILVPQGSAPAIAEAVARLVDDADLRVRLASRARKRVEGDFDGARQAARLRELFTTAITGGGRGAVATAATGVA